MQKVNLKALIFLFLLCFFVHALKAQEIAITERGDSVVLLSNGTWDYFENYVEPQKIDISRNSIKFSKPEGSNKAIMGLNDAYKLWFDPSIWKRVPASELNPDADIALKMKKGDVYAMVIYEELEIDVENLVDISFENATSMSPDISMVKKEYRVVNDNDLIHMQMDGLVQGMKISYISYYASSESGSVQFHIYTGQNLVDKYEEEIYDLLNGFILL